MRIVWMVCNVGHRLGAANCRAHSQDLSKNLAYIQDFDVICMQIAHMAFFIYCLIRSKLLKTIDIQNFYTFFINFLIPLSGIHIPCLSYSYIN